MAQDVNVLALVKGSERYIFLYDDASRVATLRTLGRYASNPELSFTWYDAAVLSQKIRQEGAAQEKLMHEDAPANKENVVPAPKHLTAKPPRFALPQPNENTQRDSDELR